VHEGLGVELKFNFNSPLSLRLRRSDMMLPPLIVSASFDSRSVEKREGRQLHSSRRDTSNISPSLGVVSMIALSGIFVRYNSRGDVWDCAKRSKREHLLCDMLRELFDLFPDVPQECVARPSADEHDGVDRDSGEVHLHCCAGSQGVCPDFKWFEAETSASNHCA